MKNLKSAEMIIDFCNLKKLSLNEILDFQKKHRVFYTKEGSKKGYEEFCLTELDKQRRFFYLIENKTIRDFKTKFEADIGQNKKPHIVLPSEKNSKELKKFLKSSQNKFASFLAKCSKGSLDPIFLKRTVDKLQGVEFSYTQTSDTWAPSFTFDLPEPKYIEAYIYLEILTLLVNRKAGKILPYVKKCFNCKKFYIAQRNNPEQKFCFKKCRLNWHNKKRIQSGESKRYKRKRRAQGLDQ